jgi:hypothetical protein
MADTGSANNGNALERGLEDYLRYARAHSDTSDTRQWVADLEDMLRVAWDLMTPEQKAAFRGHPDILAIEDAVGGGTGAA